jgi:hypothetical protein
MAKVVATVVVAQVVGELHVPVTTSMVTAETSRVTVGLPTVAVEAFKVTVGATRGALVTPRTYPAETSKRGNAPAVQPAYLNIDYHRSKTRKAVRDLFRSHSCPNFKTYGPYR